MRDKLAEEQYNRAMVREFMKENHLSINKFCKLCGIGVKSYYKIMNNDFDLGINVPFKICKAMKVHIKYFFIEVKIDNIEK